MKKLTVGSLFSGIGGFELGLEQTGHFETLWQVEIDDYATRILERHWPGVKRWRDVEEFLSEISVSTDNVRRPDLICGGFPCTPVSVAGRRAGDADERWLWPAFRDVISWLRPDYVLVENVQGLLSADDGRIFGGILRDLAERGYDAEWQMLPAGAFDLPHLRNRVFIVGYPNDGRLPLEWKPGETTIQTRTGTKAIPAGRSGRVPHED